MKPYEAINKQLNNEMQELAEKINAGNYSERDRNKLASIMYPKLRYFIWKFFNDSTETEEVLHNTLYKIFKGLESYRPDYRFTTWIYTIAKNEALLHRHKLTNQLTVRLENLTVPPHVEDDAQNNLEKEEYLGLLFALTQEEMFSMPDSIEKNILIDKEVHLMKGNDIADKYKMNLNTVKTKIRKARKMLRESVLEKNPHMKEQIKDFL